MASNITSFLSCYPDIAVGHHLATSTPTSPSASRHVTPRNSVDYDEHGKPRTLKANASTSTTATTTSSSWRRRRDAGAAPSAEALATYFSMMQK